MRQGQNGKRSRGNRRNNSNSNSNRTIDSSGPEVKIRGSASHIYEKYQSLARDANIAGERIASESYLQHAEHYLRQMNIAAANSRTPRPEGQADGDQRRDHDQRRDNDQRQDNRARPDTAPSAAPSSGNGSGEQQVVSQATAADGQEVPTGLPAAAPQQQPRRPRPRGRRPENEIQAGNGAEASAPKSTTPQNTAPKAEAPDPSPVQETEDRGPTEEA